MPSSTYKGYELQNTNTNVGTWGSTLNSNVITYIDTNLGGILNVSLSSSNVTLSQDDSRNAIIRLTGTLLSNVTVTINNLTAAPSQYGGGFYFVENLTTGNFTVSIRNTNVATAATVPQNTRATLISDATNGVRIVSDAGLPMVSTFSGGTTGLTPATATSGAVSLGGTLIVANGGTGSSSLTANYVLLGNGTNALQTVAPSTTGNVLTSNGTTWVSSTPATGANQTQMEAASSSTTYVTPAVAKYHPGVAKAWGLVSDTGVLTAGSYNISGAVRNSLGRYTVTLSTGFSSANYAILATVTNLDTSIVRVIFPTPTSGSKFNILIVSGGGDARDNSFNFCCFGDQ